MYMSFQGVQTTQKVEEKEDRGGSNLLSGKPELWIWASLPCVEMVYFGSELKLYRGRAMYGVGLRFYFCQLCEPCVFATFRWPFVWSLFFFFFLNTVTVHCVTCMSIIQLHASAFTGDAQCIVTPGENASPSDFV